MEIRNLKLYCRICNKHMKSVSRKFVNLHRKSQLHSQKLTLVGDLKVESVWSLEKSVVKKTSATANETSASVLTKVSPKKRFASDTRRGTVESQHKRRKIVIKKVVGPSISTQDKKTKELLKINTDPKSTVKHQQEVLLSLQPSKTSMSQRPPGVKQKSAQLKYKLQLPFGLHQRQHQQIPSYPIDSSKKCFPPKSTTLSVKDQHETKPVIMNVIGNKSDKNYFGLGITNKFSTSRESVKSIDCAALLCNVETHRRSTTIRIQSKTTPNNTEEPEIIRPNSIDQSPLELSPLIEYNTTMEVAKAFLKRKNVLKDVPFCTKSNVQFFLFSNNQRIDDGCGKWKRYLFQRLSARVRGEKYNFYKYWYVHKDQNDYRKVVYKYLKKVYLFQYYGVFKGNTTYKKFIASRAADILLNSELSNSIPKTKKENVHYLVNEDYCLDSEFECCWQSMNAKRKKVFHNKITNEFSNMCRFQPGEGSEVVVVLISSYTAKCKANYQKWVFAANGRHLIQFIGTQPSDCECHKHHNVRVIQEGIVKANIDKPTRSIYQSYIQHFTKEYEIDFLKRKLRCQSSNKHMLV